MELVLNLDGVVFDVVARLNILCEKEGNEKYDYSDMLLYGHHDELCSKYLDDSLFWKNLKPFEDAWHQINYWFHSGNNIICFTRCQDEDTIIQLIDGWRMPCSIHHYSNLDNRYSFLIENKEKYIIVDDNPDAVLWLIKNNFDAYLKRAWYNRDFWGHLPNIGTLYEINIENR